jgi:hypothetical protein
VSQVCVTGMLELKDFTAFKQHLRDFLVQSKSFVDKDNQELFAEEAAARQLVRALKTCINLHRSADVYLDIGMWSTLSLLLVQTLQPLQCIVKSAEICFWWELWVCLWPHITSYCSFYLYLSCHLVPDVF